uniref:Uncharacterized protein n=1 Tax=Octopus bimaculoides TaxID=37653 RepID=A0A0L8FXL7_OCTBM
MLEHYHGGGHAKFSGITENMRIGLRLGRHTDGGGDTHNYCSVTSLISFAIIWNSLKFTHTHTHA